MRYLIFLAAAIGAAGQTVVIGGGAAARHACTLAFAQQSLTFDATSCNGDGLPTHEWTVLLTTNGISTQNPGQSGLPTVASVAGGSISGAGNCTVTFAGGTGGLNAYGTVAITGGTVTAGTTVVITYPGAGYSSVPLTGTLTSNTATCTGGPVVTMSTGANALAISFGDAAIQSSSFVHASSGERYTINLVSDAGTAAPLGQPPYALTLPSNWSGRPTYSAPASNTVILSGVYSASSVNVDVNSTDFASLRWDASSCLADQSVTPISGGARAWLSSSANCDLKIENSSGTVFMPVAVTGGDVTVNTTTGVATVNSVAGTGNISGALTVTSAGSIDTHAGLLKTANCYVTNSSVDYLISNTATTEQTFLTSCAMPGLATANTVDGLHHGISVQLGLEVFGFNNTTTTVFKVKACPVGNWSGGVCNNNASTLFATSTALINVTSGIKTELDNFLITGTS
ncbi:MAG TPA: hypothetical protein VN803_08055, partial [Gemmatimonadales bacterium]|nr:hypothetical protein [Gemmatimonadales bacterium]